MSALVKVHPAAAAARAAFHADLVAEVAAAVEKHDVVVVGMAWNQPVRMARRLLDTQEIPYTYLEYGNYLVGWKRRLALKIWAGWPTFPQIWIRGTFVGGYSDLVKLKESGELAQLLGRAAG